MIRERVARLLARLATESQFPTQGRTLFVDLERQAVREAYTPRAVVEAFLGGGGGGRSVRAPALLPPPPRPPPRPSPPPRAPGTPVRLRLRHRDGDHPERIAREPHVVVAGQPHPH